MNEGLVERFARNRSAHCNSPAPQAGVWLLPQRLNTAVSGYFDSAQKPAQAGAWADRQEIPTSDEILDLPSGDASSSEVVELTPNQPEGAWESKDAYLGAHYELLREDAVRPLREAVSQIRVTPSANEDAFSGAIGIYEKVRIIGFVCSTRGIATRITFSIGRAGKKILWEQSKRLVSGSLVVLTPSNDMCRKKAVVATVAARPLAALLQNPPEVDLFIARSEELELDPAIEWVMIEARSSFFEADRHTMLALQKLMSEKFPLQEHLVNVKSHVEAPAYLIERPRLDMTSVFVNNKHETYEEIDVLRTWPNQPQSNLDASQLDALRRILTKRLAIVQGPPGTGKTFISVQAVKVMLANWKENDPPIVVTCQTNHALDQILRHIAQFEARFIRLGGMSKDKDVIKARTLYEVRRSTSDPALPGCQAPLARKKMGVLEKELAATVTPLQPTKLPIDHRKLQDLRILTEAQANSLEAGASQWVKAELTDPNEARSPFLVWLAKALVVVPPKPLAEEFAFDFEEADLEFEQLKEIEAENFAKDDEDIDALRGNAYTLADNFTCRKVPGISETKAQDILKKEQDLWRIPEAARGSVYRYLQSELKRKLLISFKEKAKAYNEQARRRRIGMWEKDENILSQQKVIGLTSTGMSKYRALLAALRCRIVLIEEAAETLEAPIIAACLPTLQHLILVGDHKQLRPHCHVKQLEDKPFFLNISLFERMVRNKVEFDTLAKQRRMIPEVRRILYPIYGDVIKDHASVVNPANRPDVPGMGGINSFFFTHQWAEQRDDFMSCINVEEAEMIIGFFEYLVYNGVQSEDITVLTFYNGQRKRILTGLRKSQPLSGSTFNVVTVDSYQGEENKIVLLSLVRSNEKSSIGFLSIDNRVCVALSRAQCGFYLFGNGMLLFKYKTWGKVIKIMAGHKRKSEVPEFHPCRLDDTFPVHCKKHNEMVDIKHASDWRELNGGCRTKCGDTLLCGHKCSLTCHPFSHELVHCQQECMRVIACGHKCSAHCFERCVCKTCAKSRPESQSVVVPTEAAGIKDLAEQSSTSSASSWRSYAKNETGHHAHASSSTPLSRGASPSKVAKAEFVQPVVSETGRESLMQLLDLSDDQKEIVSAKECMDTDRNDTTNPSTSDASVLDSDGEASNCEGDKDGEKTRLGAGRKEITVMEKGEWALEKSLLD